MNKKSLRTISRRYKILLQFLFYCVPICYGLVWYFSPTMPEHWFTRSNFNIAGGITPTIAFLGFCISMVKGTIVMMGIWSLKNLFQLYENNEFFTCNTVNCFKSLSRCLLWWVLATITTEPLLSVILTLNNPEGQKAVSISFQSADITALIVGGSLSVVASVMDMGRKLQEEAELTI